MDHPRAEDIMNLVVAESKEGKSIPLDFLLLPSPSFASMLSLEPSNMVPLWSIEKHGGVSGLRIRKKVSPSFFFQLLPLVVLFCSRPLSKVNMWSSARGGSLLQGEEVFYDKFSNFHKATLRF